VHDSPINARGAFGVLVRLGPARRMVDLLTLWLRATLPCVSPEAREIAPRLAASPCSVNTENTPPSLRWVEHRDMMALTLKTPT
jgi:hypothetical protein